MTTQTMKNGKVQYINEATGETYDSPEEALAASGESGESPILDEIMEGLDLNAPLEVKDGAGRMFSITKTQFIDYYMPPGASQAEAFHCYQAVRATGLSLLIPGECYFIRFSSDRPISLFTGYKAYLRKAYTAGLEHIATPDITHDEAGNPDKCTITLKIDGRDDFVWPTWFNEVVSMSKGKPNARWEKAPNQMFIKCAVVNTLRMSGLVDFAFPYIVEEMGDAIVNGYRSLTQEQVGEYSLPEMVDVTAPRMSVPGTEEETAEAEAGTVTAADHQVDLNPLRKSYFGKVKKLEIFAKNEPLRHDWQFETIGKRSTSEWDIADYTKAIDAVIDGQPEEWVLAQKAESIKPEPGLEKPEAAEGKAWKPEDEPNTPNGFEDEPVDGMTPEDQDKEAARQAAFIAAASAGVFEEDFVDLDITDEGTPVKLGETEPPEAPEADALQLKIDDLLAQSEEGLNLYQEFLTASLKKFSSIGARDDWFAANVEDPGGSLMIADYAKAVALVRDLPDFINGSGGADLAPKLTDETYKEIGKAVKSLGDKYGNLGSKAFRDRVREIIGHNFRSIKTLRELDGKLILTELVRESVEAGPETEEPKDELLNEEQFEMIKYQATQMPDGFGGSIASQKFRDFVTSITKGPYIPLKGLLETQGNQIIEAQKAMIRDVAETANGKSAKEAKAPHVK